ncbi:prolyl oligopeptidase family serine peptidase [Lentisphaera profundi]|uniref:Prolyl oligopeptidase family serine peptidase n=1 Tax=Lentisphaera profundi TaxID=1658616 RepID=A0ABY7VTY9_9BACT|nr:prolyl oligopeptidase family serine peptidase [Lentisphaera profundi]WDE95593.1 prolyl oligopeptidase family serine peptidase [Lentisphaera profundi]
MKYTRSLYLALLILTCTLTSSLKATPDFDHKIYKSSKGQSLNYRIHLPESMDSTKQYPLVLFFHGAGERGNDNNKQLIHGTKDILAYSKKSNAPVIIVAPQCPSGAQWVNTPWRKLSHTMPIEPSNSMRLMIELLNKSIKELPVDKTRIYVTGLSMGGYGTWDIIQRHPEIFAAAIPICGGGDTALASKLTATPIWAFHGDKDNVVKTIRSKDMINAITDAGGYPKYTEYKGVKHNSWSKTYANKDVLKWLFNQKKIEVKPLQ